MKHKGIILEGGASPRYTQQPPLYRQRHALHFFILITVCSFSCLLPFEYFFSIHVGVNIESF